MGETDKGMDGMNEVYVLNLQEMIKLSFIITEELQILAYTVEDDKVIFQYKYLLDIT